MLAKEGALQSEPASAGSLQSEPASAGSLQSEPASAGGSPTKYFDGCQGRRYNLQGYMSLSWPPDVRSSRKARDLDPAPQPTYASTPSSSGHRSALSPSRPPAPYRSARGCPRRARTCRGGRGSNPPASMASMAVRRAAVDPAAKAAGPMLRLAGVHRGVRWSCAQTSDGTRSDARHTRGIIATSRQSRPGLRLQRSATRAQPGP